MIINHLSFHVVKKNSIQRLNLEHLPQVAPQAIWFGYHEFGILHFEEPLPPLRYSETTFG